MYLQPIKSNSCGQHSVANMLNIPPVDVIKVFGKSSATRTRDLHRAFKHYGYDSPEKLVRIKAETILPPTCIIKVTWTKYQKGSHWITHIDGFIYCSCHGVYSLEKYLDFISNRGKITSCLPVNPIK